MVPFQIFSGHARPRPPLQLVTKEPMGSIGRYTDVGDGPSGACYGRRGWALRGMFLVLGPMDGWAVFFVLGTYGGWVATLENPFGTLEAVETLGTLCVALCGDKVRTNVRPLLSPKRPGTIAAACRSLLPSPCVAVSCLCSCSIVAVIWMVRDDMRDARIVS